MIANIKHILKNYGLSIKKLAHLKKNSKEKNIFNNIMNFAFELETHNPNALIDLVRILLRPMQTNLLISAIECNEHESKKAIDSYSFFMPNSSLEMRFESAGYELNNSDFLVDLIKDPILPCPWSRDRYISSLSNIGKNKFLGKWEQDHLNHYVSIWQPWGIAFVVGGNHSIATGIIGGEGKIKPTSVIDMSHLIEEVRCDGENYISIKDQKILDTVNDIRIGAVFEIGRILHKKQIMPMHV